MDRRRPARHPMGLDPSARIGAGLVLLILALPSGAAAHPVAPRFELPGLLVSQPLTCPPLNWTSAPQVWAAGPSVKVLENNTPVTNAPVIPWMSNSSWSVPSNYTVSNEVWSACPLQIALEGAGRQTVSFQLMVTADPGAAVSSASIAVTPLLGPGGTQLTSTPDLWNSSVRPFLEEYIPIGTPSGPWLPSLDTPGYAAYPNMYPDPLVPFTDPYMSGHATLVPSFSVSPGKTEGVWVDVAIPPSPVPGVYLGNVSISGTGLPPETIPLSLWVYNGTLPAFNSDPSLLMAWSPLYAGNLESGENLLPFCSLHGLTDCPMFYYTHTYQRVAHLYDFDTQLLGYEPATTLDTTTNNYSIDWTWYDRLLGPALSGLNPNGSSFYGDGTHTRVIDSPVPEGYDAGGAYGWYGFETGPPSTTPPPANLLSSLYDYALQVSQHHANQGWSGLDILGYLMDEPMGKISSVPDIYTDIALYDQALNQANGQANWSDPVRPFLTASPACTPNASSADTGSVCLVHEGLTYPNGIPYDWVLDWAPYAGLYEPGSAARTDYTMNGLAAHSSAPAASGPIEKWFYQADEPYVGGWSLNTEAPSLRSWDWIAYKYGATGIYLWASDFWLAWGQNYPVAASCQYDPYNISNTFGNTAHYGDGILFYPGNMVHCLGLPDADGSGGIRGPVVSIRMSEWRAGYQDYLYLWSLHRKELAAGTNWTGPIVDSMAGGGQSSWSALNWEVLDPYNNVGGNAGNGYVCATSSLPNGPTGSAGCPGEWTHDPFDFPRAQRMMASDLGWLAPTIFSFSATPASLGVGSSTTIQVSVGSGPGALSFAYSGLPPGCTTANAPTLTCSPTAAGSYAVRVTVSDVRSLSASASLTLSVSSGSGPALARVTVSPPSVVLATIGSTGLNVTALDTSGHPLTGGVQFTWSPSPGAPFTLNRSAGPSVEVVAASLTGVGTLAVMGTDGTVSRSAQVNVTVVSSGTLVASLTVGANPDPAGVRVGFHVATTGGTAPLSFAYSGLPPGCSSSDTPALTCLPRLSSTYNVTATVSDGTGAQATAGVLLTVLPAGPRPLIASFVASPNPAQVRYPTWLNFSVSGGAGFLTFQYQGLPSGCATRNTTWLQCVPTSAGTWVVGAEAMDTLGRSGWANVTLTVVATPPATSSGGPWGGTAALWLIGGSILVAVAVAVPLVLSRRGRRGRDALETPETPAPRLPLVDAPGPPRTGP